MDKKQIRKEIAVLINSIKEHSDNIGEKEHIPQLELELILSKIEKLYQKSIVFNFLHSEKDIKKKINEPVTKAIHDNPEISSTPVPKPIPSANTEPVKSHETSDKKNDDKIEKEEKATLREEKKPVVTNVHRPSVSDIRGAIGINDKFMLANELFNGNIQEYEIAITQLNTAESLESALEYFMSIQQLYNWDNENESVKMLYDVVERRYS